jgi:SAM-dependent methyltransferase
MPFGPRGLYRWIPRLTWQARAEVERVLARAPAGARIVDLGAGGRRISPETICLDFVPDAGTDVVGNVEVLPFRDASVDLVYATGLFEHVADERALIDEIRRVLKPGAVVHVEVPFLEQYHEDPIDCRRFTAPGLELLMRRSGFRTLASGAHIGPTVAMLNLVARWCALWLEGRGVVPRALSFGCFVALSTVFWPFKFLDAILIRREGAHRLAMGVFYTGARE